MRTRCKYTVSAAIKLWRLYNIDRLSLDEAGKKVGCHKGTASKWIKIVNKNPSLLEKAVQGTECSRSKGDTPIAKKFEELDALQDENSFLLWWNQGERKGWVDRLLKKVQE